MLKLAVSHAKEINKRLGAKGTVIIVFRDDGTFEVCEYGRSKAECSKLKAWIDELAKSVETGLLPSPWVPA